MRLSQSLLCLILSILATITITHASPMFKSNGISRSSSSTSISSLWPSRTRSFKDTVGLGESGPHKGKITVLLLKRVIKIAISLSYLGTGPGALHNIMNPEDFQKVVRYLPIKPSDAGDSYVESLARIWSKYASRFRLEYEKVYDNDNYLDIVEETSLGSLFKELRKWLRKSPNWIDGVPTNHQETIERLSYNRTQVSYSSVSHSDEE